jgi:hypothetical protein
LQPHRRIENPPQAASLPTVQRSLNYETNF